MKNRLFIRVSLIKRLEATGLTEWAHISESRLTDSSFSLKVEFLRLLGLWAQKIIRILFLLALATKLLLQFNLHVKGQQFLKMFVNKL